MRIVVGDDYGVVTIPHGDYADELEFYVKEIGIPALDVIRWATQHGAPPLPPPPTRRTSREHLLMS